ncbi:MAG: DNA polymerase IV [Rhodocyclaceae bacterium]|nr:DNA polymerase IV [Rhodocyclaceae bacterium]MBL0077435.1 DNA polymerase IV [Rhodocyclaceae bacterium]MBP6108831.1 DNA polymerase IV [Rhodocyclaceae bacterium]MBP6278965.1 DNA polymerase IV [Rhodocyclaceae bacterium]
MTEPIRSIGPMRRIAHLDMDAFYASVELLRYPDLRGQPVVIGGRSADQPVTQSDGTRTYARLKDYVGRGVTTTSTYEARALGVFSGMGVMKAAKLAPEAILLPIDFAAYRHYSRLFKAAVATVAPHIEDRGIDEIYIDLSEIPDDSLTIAQRLKAAVHEATGLTCSIGITPNKLLSKICSDLDKPNGITIMADGDLQSRIWPLPAKKINGIGPKANEKLAALGIVTIADLAAADPALLQENFGRSFAAWMLDAAQGIDNRPISTDSEPRTISRETTFEHDMHARRNKAELSEIFTDLCTGLARDLQRKGYLAHTIGIKLRFDDFRIVTRDFTLDVAINDAVQIRRAAGECLRRAPLEKKLRLLGVKANNLVTIEAANAEPVADQLALGW